MSAVLLLLLSLLPTAHAGDGPWTLNPGELNLYLGGDYFRYGEYTGGKAAGRQALASPLTAAGVTAVATLGLLQGVETELVLPFESVRANDPENAGCVEGPRPEWCEPTAGIGDVSGAIKGRLLDELIRSPVTLSVSAGFRTGEAYAGKRGRLTTLGDGQTDVGAGLAVGRTNALPRRGWYRLGAQGAYWYRFPNTVGAESKRPADEVAFAVDTAFSFGPPFAVGPALYGFHRTRGVDIEQADFSNIDVFSSLHATQVKVGGKLGIFGAGGRTISLTVLRTVYAVNNPSDTLSLSLGIGWFMRPDLGAG